MDEFYYDCDVCKAIVKDEKYYLSADEEKERYDSHNNDINDLGYQNYTSPITDHVIEKFLPSDKGLDFGSGPGAVISSMLIKKGYDVVQYDPFYAPEQNLLDRKYDYVFSCEVFEHFYNPQTEIDRILSILVDNGMLLIMTMLYNDDIDFSKWYYRNDSTHVFIYRKETMNYIARKYNLKVEILSNRFIILRK